MQIKYIFIPLFLIMILGFAISLNQQISHISTLADEPFYFLIGCVVAILWQGLSKTPVWQIIFVHEFTHVLFARLFRADVRSMLVSPRRGGGYVKHSKTIPFAEDLIALAPYFFPLFPLLWTAQMWIARYEFHNVIAGIIGFTLIGYFFDLAYMLRKPQSDLTKVGLPLSIAIILFFNIFFVGIVLCGISEETSIAGFLRNGIYHIWNLLRFRF